MLNHFLLLRYCIVIFHFKRFFPLFFVLFVVCLYFFYCTPGLMSRLLRRTIITQCQLALLSMFPVSFENFAPRHDVTSVSASDFHIHCAFLSAICRLIKPTSMSRRPPPIIPPGALIQILILIRILLDDGLAAFKKRHSRLSFTCF